jgi:hypothetical protein
LTNLHGGQEGANGWALVATRKHTQPVLAAFAILLPYKTLASMALTVIILRAAPFVALL